MNGHRIVAAAMVYKDVAMAEDMASATGTTSGVGGELGGKWGRYVDRYRGGEDRSVVFRDMVLDDIRERGGNQTVLDIGCGEGFDSEFELQETIARASGRYIGVEPDTEIKLAPYSAEAHRCIFEEAPVAANSVDVAFAVMVLEHLRRPQAFWDKVWEVLVDGGVFWGMTVDGRHWFCKASLWTQRLRVKEYYLDMLRRTGSGGMYDNYAVHYQSNSPEQVKRYTRRFKSVELINFLRVGQCNSCFPKVLRGLVNRLERRAMQRGKPGVLLAIRVVK